MLTVWAAGIAFIHPLYKMGGDPVSLLVLAAFSAVPLWIGLSLYWIADGIWEGIKWAYGTRRRKSR